MELYMLSGYAAAFFYSIMQLPQIYKVIQRKSADDISILFYVLFLCASLLMLFYSTQIQAFPVMINNAVQATCCLIMIGLYFRYKPKNGLKYSMV